MPRENGQILGETGESVRDMVLTILERSEKARAELRRNTLAQLSAVLPFPFLCFLMFVHSCIVLMFVHSCIVCNPARLLALNADKPSLLSSGEENEENEIIDEAAGDCACPRQSV
jgi:hypothetical protein